MEHPRVPPGSPSRKPRQRLSLLGYAVLNLGAAAVLLVAYWFSLRLKIGHKPLEPYGLAVPMVFVWLCFVAASVLDAVYDRVADGKSKEPRRDSRSRSREKVSRVSGIERLSRD